GTTPRSFDRLRLSQDDRTGRHRTVARRAGRHFKGALMWRTRIMAGQVTAVTAESPRSREQSAALEARATRVIPGGGNSPVRAFKAVGGGPVFIRRGGGCTVEDVDGNRYLDYLGSWGPLILGHAH